MAPVSVTCRRPRSSTIASGSPPVSNMMANTSLAIRPLIASVLDQVEQLAQARGADRAVLDALAGLAEQRRTGR